MEEEKKTRSKPRKGHPVRNAAIGGTAGLLLLIGGCFGLGKGMGLGPAAGLYVNENTGEAPKAEQAIVETVAPEPVQETAVPTAEPEEVQPIIISVHESKILIDGKEITLDTLEETLKDVVTDGRPVRLEDDHGIKAAYDTVVTILQKLDIPFTTGN